MEQILHRPQIEQVLANAYKSNLRQKQQFSLMLVMALVRKEPTREQHRLKQLTLPILVCVWQCRIKPMQQLILQSGQIPRDKLPRLTTLQNRPQP